MHKLSDRLLLIAEQVTCGGVAADIGTDHGYLPMYLLESGKAKHVILTDVSRGSLDKARRNMAGCGEDASKYELRLGDGMRVLEKGEADEVVIAGMGGILISEILDAEPEKTRAVRRFVLQPRSSAEDLRYYLAREGFNIEKELLVREGRFICQVIVCAPGGEKRSDIPQEGDITYAIPEAIAMCGDPARDFLKRELRTRVRILSQMPLAEVGKRRKLEGDIEYIKGLLKRTI